MDDVLADSGVAAAACPPALRVAENRHCDAYGGSAGQIASVDAGARAASGGRRPPGELFEPFHFHVPGQFHRHDEGDRARPHGHGVRQALHGRAPADVVAGGPVAGEVRPFDEHVRGDCDAFPRQAQHGAVVARGDVGLRGPGQRRDDPGQQFVLAQVVDAHGPIMPSPPRLDVRRLPLR